MKPYALGEDSSHTAAGRSITTRAVTLLSTPEPSDHRRVDVPWSVSEDRRGEVVVFKKLRLSHGESTLRHAVGRGFSLQRFHHRDARKVMPCARVMNPLAFSAAVRRSRARLGDWPGRASITSRRPPSQERAERTEGQSSLRFSPRIGSRSPGWRPSWSSRAGCS